MFPINYHTTQSMLFQVVGNTNICFFSPPHRMIWKHLFEVVTVKFSGIVFLPVLLSIGTKCPASIIQSNIQNVAYLEQLSQAEQQRNALVPGSSGETASKRSIHGHTHRLLFSL